MNVYVYAADLYCKPCGDAIRARLDADGKAPEDPDDERTYDSGDYPKGPYPDGGGESDSPAHCGSHSRCRLALVTMCKNPQTGKRQRYKVGVWLENPLTPEGVEYVRQAIARNPRGAISRLWRQWYAEELAG